MNKCGEDSDSEDAELKQKKQTTVDLKLTENSFGLIHGFRGCVYLVK